MGKLYENNGAVYKIVGKTPTRKTNFTLDVVAKVTGKHDGFIFVVKPQNDADEGSSGGREVYVATSDCNCPKGFITSLNSGISGGGLISTMTANDLGDYIMDKVGEYYAGEVRQIYKSVHIIGNQEEKIYVLSSQVTIGSTLEKYIVLPPLNEFSIQLSNGDGQMGLYNLIKEMQSIFQHNYKPALFVIGSAAMMLHREAIMTLYNGCPIPVAYSLFCGVGKSTALNIARQLLGEGMAYSVKKATRAYFRSICHLTTFPLFYDDPKETSELGDIASDLYEAGVQGTVSYGKVVPRCGMIAASNFSYANNDRYQSRLAIVPFFPPSLKVEGSLADVDRLCYNATGILPALLRINFLDDHETIIKAHLEGLVTRVLKDSILPSRVINAQVLLLYFTCKVICLSGHEMTFDEIFNYWVDVALPVLKQEHGYTESSTNAAEAVISTVCRAVQRGALQVYEALSFLNPNTKYNKEDAVAICLLKANDLLAEHIGISNFTKQMRLLGLGSQKTEPRDFLSDEGVAGRLCSIPARRADNKNLLISRRSHVLYKRMINESLLQELHKAFNSGNESEGNESDHTESEILGNKDLNDSGIEIQDDLQICGETAVIQQLLCRDVANLHSGDVPQDANAMEDNQTLRDDNNLNVVQDADSGENATCMDHEASGIDQADTLFDDSMVQGTGIGSVIDDAMKATTSMDTKKSKTKDKQTKMRKSKHRCVRCNKGNWKTRSINKIFCIQCHYWEHVNCAENHTPNDHLCKYCI